MKPARVSVGHPIDVSSGAQFTAAHDVALPGAMPLVRRRFYSTDLKSREGSILGHGTVHFFDMTLTRHAGGYTFFGHDGATVEFQDPRGNVERGSKCLSAAAFMDLRRDGDHYVVYHWHDWQVDVKKMVFEASVAQPMKLVAVESPAGHGNVAEYNSRGQVVEVRGRVEGRGLKLEYSAAGLLGRLRRTSPIAEPEVVVEYEYDAGERLVLVRDVAGQTTRYAYDDAGRLVEEVGGTSARYTMKYDSRGRCIEATGDNGYGRRRLQYDEAGLVTLVVDSLGHVTTYRLNSRGQVAAVVLPDGARRSTEFDDFGRVSARTSATSETTRYGYDLDGNVASVTAPGGAVTEFTYEADHQPRSVRFADGATWQMEYERSALTAVRDPIGAVTRYRRDEQNIVGAVEYPGGNVVRIERAADWSAQTVSDAFGVIEKREYDGWLRPMAVTVANGITTSYEYDQVGRLRGAVNSLGRRWSFEMDAAATQLRVTDPLGATSILGFSGYGDLIRVTDRNGLTHRYEIDSEGRLAGVVNPKGEKASIRFNDVGDVAERVSFDGRRDRFRYDAASRMTSHENDSGSIAVQYDDRGNAESVTSGGRVLIENRYDMMNRMVYTRTADRTIQLRYDLAGRLIEEDQDGHSLKTTYRREGGLARQEFDMWPLGARSYGYDARNRLTRFGSGEATWQRHEYDAADRMTRRLFEGSEERFGYDGAGQLSRQVVVAAAGATIVERVFEHDALGELTGVRDSLRGFHEYKYDPARRLTGSTNAGTSAYEYDECGNLLRNGGERLSYGSGNRLESIGAMQARHDANGNLVELRGEDGSTRFEWNELGQLREVRHDDGSTTRYGYDGIGRRVAKEHKGRRTEFYWAGDVLASERTGDRITEYVHSGAVPVMVACGGQRFDVIAGPSLLPLEMLGANGEMAWRGDFDDWGRLLRQSGEATVPMPVRFLGQYADSETGLHYNRFRYYLPQAGQFLSPDPLSFSRHPNEFRYAPNPISWCDPYGLICGNVGCPDYAVYVLKNPAGQVVYVGITMQDPQKRCDQHTSSGKVFHHMDVIATYTVGPSATNRQLARSLEGSCLYNVGSGSHAMGGTHPTTIPVPAAALQNAVKMNGQYYHSYAPGNGNYLGSASTVMDLNHVMLDGTGAPMTYQ